MLTSLMSLQLDKNSKGSKSSLEFVVLASMNNSLLPRYLFKAEKKKIPSLPWWTKPRLTTKHKIADCYSAVSLGCHRNPETDAKVIN